MNFPNIELPEIDDSMTHVLKGVTVLEKGPTGPHTRAERGTLKDVSLEDAAHVYGATIVSSALMDWAGVHGAWARVHHATMEGASLVVSPRTASGWEDELHGYGLSTIMLVKLTGWDAVGPMARIVGGRDLVSVVWKGEAFTAYRSKMPVQTWEALMGRKFDCIPCATTTNRCSLCPPDPWRVVSRGMTTRSLRRSYFGEGGALLNMMPRIPNEVNEALMDLVAKRQVDTGSYYEIKDRTVVRPEIPIL